MASVVNVEVVHLKLSSVVVESECRRDGYYYAKRFNGNFVIVKSVNGLLITLDGHYLAPWDVDYVEIDSRRDNLKDMYEMRISNHSENSQPTE